MCYLILTLCLSAVADHSDLQVLPRLYRSEGVSSHYWGSALGFSGWDAQRRWKRQPDHCGAGRLWSGSAGEDTGPLYRHFHHYPACGQLPNLCYPHARGYPGLFGGQWRPAALPARLPAQRAHQRAHAGPSEPATPPAGHQHRAGSSEAPSPGLHSGAGHSKV